MILDGKGLTHHLTKEAGPIASNISQWKANDATVRAWLPSSLKPELFNKYLLLGSSKKIWDKIHKSCLQQSNDWRIYDLTIKIAMVKQGD